MARMRAVASGLLAVAVALLLLVGLTAAAYASGEAMAGSVAAVGADAATAPEPGDVEVRHDTARVAVKHRGAGSLHVRDAAAAARWLLPALALLVLPALAPARARVGAPGVLGRMSRAPPAVTV